MYIVVFFFFFKQKTAYEMRISDWSSDVCSSDLDETGDAAAAEGGSALGPAGGFIRQALETIRHDLAKALQAFGFDSSAIQNFSTAFVEPVLSELKEGVNLTAELSFAALRQVTTRSSTGESRQSTPLVPPSPPT